MPLRLRKIVSFIGWVIRLGGAVGALRDIYQVLAYLAAYGPPLIVAALLSTLGFAERMDIWLRVAFFVGVFFCTLAVSGTALALAVRHFLAPGGRAAPENRSTSTPEPVPAGADAPSAASSGTARAWQPTIVDSTDKRPLIQDDELSHRFPEKKTIRMGEYARKLAPGGEAQAIIRDRIFRDCDIYGPAVLGPLSRDQIEEVFVNCDWREGETYVPWLPAENRQEYIGTVRLENCVFERCTISRVGVLRQEEPSPTEQLRAHEKRISLKGLLLAARVKGLSLRQHVFNLEDAGHWVTRTRDLIEAALGRREADRFPLGSPFAHKDQSKSVERYYLDVHLERLSKLIERVDSLEPLELRSDFDPQEWLNSR